MNIPQSSLTRHLLAGLLALGLPAVLSAADAFEGRIHMQMLDGKKQAAQMDYEIKGTKARINMQSEQTGAHGSPFGGMIMDFENHEMIILFAINGQKQYMRRPIAAPGAQPPSAQRHGDSGGGEPMAPPVPTGKTDTIAGYPATEYTGKSANGETYDLWLATGLGNFMFPAGGNPMARGNANTAPGWEAIARNGGFFPLRVITHDAKGVEKGRFEVTKIDRGTVPDSEFSLDGYTEFSMGAFMPH